MNNLNERMELYKLYVKSAEQISSARMKANAFFLTLNAAPFVNFLKIDKTLALLLAVLINICWFLLLRSYKKLNSAKFKVIQEMEKKLPYHCFKIEEEYYRLNKRKDFSTIEKFVPIVIIFSYFMNLLLDFRCYKVKCYGLNWDVLHTIIYYCFISFVTISTMRLYKWWRK